VRLSPTTWKPKLAMNFCHTSQSSWSKGSSTDTSAYVVLDEGQPAGQASSGDLKN
jgi:hypothetical protein